MTQRVRANGAQFAQLSTRQNIPYSNSVLNNDEVLNAFAAPGGPVFVTRKLVTTTSNDAELAYVLGHETGHIERKHIVASVERQQKAGLLVGVLGSILGKGKSGDLIGTIGNVAFTVWDRGYSRDQEREADIVGTRFMSQLGYDPQAAITMLGKLGEGGGGFLDKYLATHPDPKSRQQLVAGTIASEHLDDVARRSGGPRLWMTGAPQNGNTPYPGTGYAPGYDNTYNTYGDNGGTTYPSYSAPTNTAPTYTPPYPTNGTSSNERIELRTPLLLATRGSGKVVLGPVLEIARWAGATARGEGRAMVFRRSGNTLVLRPNSKTATLNRSNVTMSAPATEYKGTLYAPLGVVAEGLGGQASYDAQTRTIWLTIGNQRGYLPLQ